mgnify:CR=1 FL=1|jgi:macrolide transport system ATP-binding/permease protein
MLLLEAYNIQKYYGDRLVLNVPELRIYSQDRIGVIGPNGAGKTTLLDILSGRLEPDSGRVSLYGTSAYLTQLDPPQADASLDPEMAARFSVPTQPHGWMSGGEQTRFKLAQILSNRSTHLIFADEPTSSIDIEGIDLLETMFTEYRGALVVISHDRDFLDQICTQIMEVEAGKIKLYPGNYSNYAEQKAQERARMEFEYTQYIKEKQRLEAAAIRIKQKSQSIKGPPKRMGNSEARLHKMGGQKGKATLDRAVKNIEKRIDKLEVKDKPHQPGEIKFDLGDRRVSSKGIIVSGTQINKAFGSKVIFRSAEFRIYTNTKTALIGPNGCGKSTLLKMILTGESGIKVAPSAKIGYFSQAMDILDENLSVLENVMSTSIHDQTTVRTMLAGLLFKRDDVYKPVGVLSAGERVKAAFAKILTQDFNLLLLDEPTNYLDINSLEAVEAAFKEYQGTMLFVSHDRRLIHAVADEIIIVADHQLIHYRGTYQEYLDHKQKAESSDSKEQQILVLEHRLAEIINRLSAPSPQDDPEALDLEFKKILAQLKLLRS